MTNRKRCRAGKSAGGRKDARNGKSTTKRKSQYVIVNSVKDRLKKHRQGRAKEIPKQTKKRNLAKSSKETRHRQQGEGEIGTLEKTATMRKEDGIKHSNNVKGEAMGVFSKTGKFELVFPFNAEVAHAAMNIGDSGGIFGTKSIASKDPSWLQQQQQSIKAVVKGIAQLERVARKTQRGMVL